MGLGKLVLKGGEQVGSVSKKKGKKKRKPQQQLDEASAAPAEGAAGDEAGPDGAAEGAEPGTAKPPPKLEYEKEFKFETARMQEGKARSTAWGATYKAPPEILHGYNRKVTGDTYEERLDLRCAKKADRMCK